MQILYGRWLAQEVGMMDTKVCNVCHIEFPATREYFYPNKLGKFGLRPDCKSCASARNRAFRQRPEQREYARQYARYWREKNPEKYREQSRRKIDRERTPYGAELEQRRVEGKRCCSDCKQLFPATREYFVKSNTQPLGIGYRCKTCNNINSKRQYARKKAQQVNR